jgi:hypothetical protein
MCPSQTEATKCSCRIHWEKNILKKQKRLIVTLVSGLILGGVSSLGLAQDYGTPCCAHSHKSYQSGQYHDRWDDCAHRSRKSWQHRGYDYGKSGCAHRSHKSWQERKRREREASRVQLQFEREIDALVERDLYALEQRQKKCR